jgi:hypothetical protein
MSRTSLWPQAIIFFLLCLVACAIEPCDGHSCEEVTIVKE